MYPVKLLPGISQCITEACTEIVTSYTNSIEEIFVHHLINFLIIFLIYNLQTKFCGKINFFSLKKTTILHQIFIVMQVYSLYPRYWLEMYQNYFFIKIYAKEKPLGLQAIFLPMI